MLDRRIGAYLDKLPTGLGEGMHRDDYGFLFSAFLVRDLALSEAEALQWLEVWDSRNGVRKGTDRLKGLIQSAHAYGKHPYGSGLTQPSSGTAQQNKHRHPLRRIRVVVEGTP